MKEFTIRIPTTQQEITLQQYQALIKLNQEDPEINLKMIAILCDLSEEVVREIPVADVDDIMAILTNTLTAQQHFRNRFKLNGVEYGFIPNLDEMTLGEYIDIDKYIQKEEDLHKVMSILYREVEYVSNGLYRIKKYTAKEDYNIMLNAPLDVVNGAMVFFWDLGNALLNNMPAFLHKELQKAIASKQISQADGDGTVASIRLLINNLEELMKSPNRIYTNAFYTYPSLKKNKKQTIK